MVLNTPPLSSLPLVAKVDILVVGGTSAAVSFALAARKSGASVYLVSSRPYLGEDICAAYRFWDQSSNPGGLAQRIFKDSARPPTPMRVKYTLEQSLVAADIPFLFNCSSAGVLRSESGQICGAAIANRSGHQAIQARLVVDATIQGNVLRQAGVASGELHRLQGEQVVDYVALYQGEGAVDASSEEFIELAGYHDLEGWGGVICSISARRYTVTADFGDGSPQAQADAFSQVSRRCWLPKEFRHQTLLTRKMAPQAAVPELNDVLLQPGLLALSEAAKLPAGIEAIFASPISAMNQAEEMGKQAMHHLPDFDSAVIRVDCHGAEPINCGTMRTLTDALRPGTEGLGSVAVDLTRIPVLGVYDVVVAGGGTGGAPAGISAARSGASTLVVEATSGLGGVGTMGQIANYWFGNRVGFTSEIDRGARKLEHDPYFEEHTGSWSVAAKRAWYHQTGHQEGCTYWFNTFCVGTVVDQDRVTGLILAGPYGYGLVKSGCVVDSTGCSDIPAAAGAPTVVIGKEHIAVQGTGLAGVNPKRDYHNSDHSFSDDTDVVDATAFMVSAKVKFKDDFDCGELIDSRERRQIIGDFSIAPVDILLERRFPDTICVATSNFDSHGFTVDPVFMLVPPDKHEPLWADIPLRCLLPQGLDGVLVTGLALSAHRDALPVIRMQADVQNQGYAAGYIAAQSARTGQALRDLDVRSIQRHLIEIGGLPKRVLTDQDSFPVSGARLKSAVEEEWDTLAGVALMLSDGERSLQLVKEAYLAIVGESSAQSMRYAQILALLGDASGRDELTRKIMASPWDDGWAFRGMHQFGMNMSPLDSLIVCLGMVGDASTWDCLLKKIESMPQDADFSHFRAIAMACESLYQRYPNTRVAAAIADLLQRPNYQGYAQTDLNAAQAALTEDINENDVRGRALRELHIARALYNCGDHDGLGRRSLECYSCDVRGHFARHARAVLRTV